MNADVLMLDKPTGHLDGDNIKWLEIGWSPSLAILFPLPISHPSSMNVQSNNDKGSVEFKSTELSVDEEAAQPQSGALIL